VHALIFVRPALPGMVPDVRGLGESMFARWSDALVAKDFAAPLIDKGGLEAHLVLDAETAGDYLAGYFTKNGYKGPAAAAESVAYEMQPADLKSAKLGNRTPFAILADVVQLGDAEDLDTWHEYERASKGRRQLTWSRRMRDKLRLEVERSDAEIAGETLEGADVAVFSGWELVRMRAPELLLVSGLDLPAAVAFVRAWLLGAGCVLHE
jgi:hypothetical protein